MADKDFKGFKKDEDTYNCYDPTARSSINSLTPRVGIAEGKITTLQEQMLSVQNSLDDLGTASTKNSTSVVTDSTDLVESGAVCRAIGIDFKNLLPNNLSSGTYGNSCVITHNTNGSITVSGQNTSGGGDITIEICTLPYDTVKGLYLSGVSNGSSTTYMLFAQIQNASLGYVSEVNNVEGKTLIPTGIEQADSVRFSVRVKGGYSFPNPVTIYPMISKDGGVYEPYHASVDDTLRDAEVIEGKNLLPVTLKGIKELNTSGTWSGNTYTIYNMTFTVETDGDKVVGIDVNGTADYNTSFKIGLPLGGDILTGCPTGGGWNNYILYQSNGATDSGEGATGVITTSYISIYVKAGYNVQHKKFYPMIRLATEDATYEPYYIPLKDVVPQKCDNSVIGTVEDGATASQAYAVGEHFIKDGQFKEVTQPIASGGAISDSNTVDKPIADLLDVIDITSDILNGALPEGVTLGTSSKIYKIGHLIIGNIVVKNSNGFSADNQTNIIIKGMYSPTTSINSYCYMADNEWNAVTDKDMGYFYVGSNVLGFRKLDSTKTLTVAKATFVYVV